MHWTEILKRLREEQNKKYYREEDRPALQLPLPPVYEYPIENTPLRPQEEEERGVVIIDIYNID